MQSLVLMEYSAPKPLLVNMHAACSVRLRNGFFLYLRRLFVRSPFLLLPTLAGILSRMASHKDRAASDLGCLHIFHKYGMNGDVLVRAPLCPSGPSIIRM